MKLQNKVFRLSQQIDVKRIQKSLLVLNENLSEIELAKILISPTYSRVTIDGYSVLEALKFDDEGAYLEINEEKVYVKFLDTENNTQFSINKITNALFMYPDRTVSQEYINAIIEDIYLSSKQENKQIETEIVEQKEEEKREILFKDSIINYEMKEFVEKYGFKKYREGNFVLFIKEDTKDVLFYEIVDEDGNYEVVFSEDLIMTEGNKESFLKGEEIEAQTSIGTCLVSFDGTKLTIKC